MTSYNIYCDESCHLENDHQQVMVLGSVWCPTIESHAIACRIRSIKKNHGLSPYFEIKWTKVSPGKKDFYLELLDDFFKDANLHFRALIIPDKSKLQHSAFGHDHDAWYYKMYFEMIKVLLSPKDSYRIYIDIKDTLSGSRLAKLHDVLCNNNYDFERKIIERVQPIRSHEVEQLQLADLLIGCVISANRGNLSPTKLALTEYVRKKSGYCLTRTTLLQEKKINLLRWQASEV